MLVYVLTFKLSQRKSIKGSFVTHMVSCIPQNEMVVLARDINGHVGSSNVGYDGMHSGYGYGAKNADGSRILDFTDRLNLVICNTVSMKQESKLVTYVAGSVQSMVDYYCTAGGQS